jgi:MFS family permease
MDRFVSAADSCVATNGFVRAGLRDLWGTKVQFGGDQREVSKSTRLPRSVWVLSWISFFADVSSEMVYPILPLFMAHVLLCSKSQLGLMEGAAVFLVALMSAYAGFQSDRTGPKGGRVKWIRIGYGMPVLGKAIIALSTFWPSMMVGRLLDRFGKGLRGAPRDALITDAVSADQRGRAFGLHRAFDTTGALLGVLLSAFLLWWLTATPGYSATQDALERASQTPAWVYRVILWLGALLGLAALALAFLVQEVKTETATQSVSETNLPASLSIWRRMPMSYWIVLTILGLFSLANSSDTFLLLRASDLGYSSWAVVLAYALFNVTYAGLSYPIGVLSDRYGRWRMIAVGWAIYASVYATIAWLPKSQAWGLWPLMAVYGIYMALTDGVGKALIADHAPKESRGAAMGIFYCLTGLSTLLASLLTGVIWDRVGPQGLASFSVVSQPPLNERWIESHIGSTASGVKQHRPSPPPTLCRWSADRRATSGDCGAGSN